MACLRIVTADKFYGEFLLDANNDSVRTDLFLSVSSIQQFPNSLRKQEIGQLSILFQCYLAFNVKLKSLFLGYVFRVVVD